MATATTYRCDDGNCPLDIEAESAQEAAQEYVDGGDWGEATETQWISVNCWLLDEDGHPGDNCDVETVLVEVDAEEPECSHEQGHEWLHRFTRGHGGGVIVTEVCGRCGMVRTTDTWHQDHCTGHLCPGDHVRYEGVDDSWTPDDEDDDE